MKNSAAPVPHLLASLCLALLSWMGAPQGAQAAAFDTTAPHAILMDATSGEVLFEKQADTLMKPASMSKLVTLAVLFERLKDGSLKLDDTFEVSEKAWRVEGSEMFLALGSRVRIEDLIRGIIVQSGNDACIVVAEGISGTEDEFTEEMTDYARRHGMKKSTFGDSSGLPHEKQWMTPRELAILAHKMITLYPEYYHYFGEKEFVWSNIHQKNRNPLIFDYPGADGLKTGHTEESGYGLVGSAVQKGRRLILVLNGLESESARAIESKRLLDWGFREFKRYDLFAKGAVVDEAPVWSGEYDKVPLVSAKPVTVYMRRADRRNMKVSVHYNAPIAAPIKAGSKLAVLRISAPDMKTKEFDLVAGGPVDEAGFFAKGFAAFKALILGSDEK